MNSNVHLRSGLLMLVATAMIVTLGLVPADAETSGQVDDTRYSAEPPRKKKVEQRRKEWFRLTFKVKRHQRRIVHIRGTGSTGNGSGSMRVTVQRDSLRREAFTCVKSARDRLVIPYEPLKISMSGNSFTSRWLMFTYRVDKARRVSGVVTQQFEMCAVGGGHTWNKWASNFNGSSVTLSNWQDIRIGQAWGERVADDGGIHTDLGFQLSRGGAEVSASLPVGIDDEHTFTGTDGYDKRIDLPDGWDDVNRVNAYYESDDNWTFQGTDRYVGNTLQVLYETPQSGTKVLNTVLSTKIAAHCTKWWQLFGRDCEDFD